jgi:hypothetical protein
MTTPLDVLIAGRELLADPKNWTQRTLARNKAGDAVPDPWDPKATCFCSLGAVHKVVGKGTHLLPLKSKVRELLHQAVPRHDNVVFFNDRSTHTEVLDLWDRAIELARHE